MNQVLHDFKFIYLIKKLENLKEKKFGKTCVILYLIFFSWVVERIKEKDIVCHFIYFLRFLFFISSCFSFVFKNM